MDANGHIPGSDVARLKDRLQELEETLYAIRTGQVDALVDGTDVYTLESAETASNRFRGLVMQQINDTVIAVDNDHRVTYVNEAGEQVYGVKSADVLGLRLSRMYTYRWVRPGDEEASLEALRTTGKWRGENIHVKHDGEEIHVESVVTMLRDADGASIGLLSVMRDITQRVRDRAALEESDRQKDRFLATLAHELRNPLSPLMNGLHLLDDDPSHARLHGMMHRQLDHLVRLVDDLMDMSRISRGKLELRKQRVDLRTVLSTALEASGPGIEAHGHQLTVEAGGAPLYHNGDTTRLAQIISNLLNNAAKYTPKGGEVRVTLQAEGNEAVLRVKDNGIGIDAAAIDGIFEMFTQVEDPQHANGGLGIGLNIAQRLTAMHHGRLSARSEGLGKGSTFELRLPLAMEGAKATATNGTPKAAERPQHGLNILVVDDNTDVAETMALVLRKHGHAVEVAHSGLDALAKGHDQRPDVVFMDIGMPDMDGHDTCERMRQQRWGQRARIVAVSGWGQAQDRERSQQAGFDVHLVKPIDWGTISRVLEPLATA